MIVFSCFTPVNEGTAKSRNCQVFFLCFFPVRFDTFGRTILKETIEDADDFKAKREQFVPGYGRYDDPKSGAAAEKRDPFTDQEGDKLAA